MAERKLAYIVTVDDIRPIDGYDRIELATVLGWHCVVGKGMRAGDRAVYFEIDSLLPNDDDRFAFCEKYKWRIKTQRMCRGAVLSQGLLMPLSDFPELADLNPGDDVTDRLRVTYYEPQDQFRKAPAPDKYKRMAQRYAKLFKRQPFRWLMRRGWGRKFLFLIFGNRRDKRGWPAWVRKTDEDRIQVVPWLLSNGVAWVATEKVDGTSCTWTMRRRSLGRKEMTVCSRNVAFTPDDRSPVWYDTNVYTEAAERYHARELLTELLNERPSAEWVTIQGEIYGGGIQKRDYGIGDHRFAAFNLIYSDTGRLGTLEMLKILGNRVPCVPLISGSMPLPNDVDAVVALADGPSRIDGGMREGIVFRSPDGQQSFKAVSNEYLLKYHG